MKKIGHKNQIVITTMALLLAAVGYISYDYQNGDLLGKKAKDTTPASAQTAELAKNLENENTEAILNAGQTVLTSNLYDNAGYVAEVKLNREQVRSKNKEVLQEVINNETLTEEEKKSAVDEMVTITETAQMEADAEMLLESKGFSDVVVSISEGSCDVVLDMGEVTDSKRAQVEDIVKRKTNIAADKIVITTLNNQADVVE